jgi:hypothetical protein
MKTRDFKEQQKDFFMLAIQLIDLSCDELNINSQEIIFCRCHPSEFYYVYRINISFSTLINEQEIQKLRDLLGKRLFKNYKTDKPISE